MQIINVSNGKILDTIYSDTERGASLTFTAESNYLGGVKLVKFQLATFANFKPAAMSICIVQQKDKTLYTGYFSVVPDLETTDSMVEYQVKGFWDYLKLIKFTKNYTENNKSWVVNFTTILIDTIGAIREYENIKDGTDKTNYIIKMTDTDTTDAELEKNDFKNKIGTLRSEFNNNIILAKDSGWDFNKKPISSVYTDLLKFINSYYFQKERDKTIKQYTILVYYKLDTNQIVIHFKRLNVQKEHLIETKNFNEIKVKKSVNKIINSVDVYIRVEEQIGSVKTNKVPVTLKLGTSNIDDSNVGTIEDDDSISLYGKKVKDLVFSNAMPPFVANRIARDYINTYKDPLLNISIKDYFINTILPFGFYFIKTVINLIKQDLSYFDNIDKIDMTAVGNTVTKKYNTVDFLFGSRSIELSVDNFYNLSEQNAVYIKLDETIHQITKVSFWVKLYSRDSRIINPKVTFILYSKEGATASISYIGKAKWEEITLVISSEINVHRLFVWLEENYFYDVIADGENFMQYIDAHGRGEYGWFLFDDGKGTNPLSAFQNPNVEPPPEKYIKVAESANITDLDKIGIIFNTHNSTLLLDKVSVESYRTQDYLEILRKRKEKFEYNYLTSNLEFGLYQDTVDANLLEEFERTELLYESKYLTEEKNK